MMGIVYADKAKGSPNVLGAKSYGTKSTLKICGDKLCRDAKKAPKTQPASEQTEKPVETPMEKPMTEKPAMEKSAMEKTDQVVSHMYTITSKTVTSVKDPGIGHESHQLAVILPPSEKIYKGSITFSASQPVQLVALTGPLADGEDKGQPIWTPDGKTKFALTLVDPQAAAGTWNFAGNALAIHTKKTEPFTASYTVSYMEKEKSDIVKTGTLTSVKDPGVGHESHQLAIILAPSEKPYSGMLTYSASEPVQLVALTGPLADGEDKGQPIWTPDGKTKFALTLVDPQAAAGTWNFAGNALAIHTKNTTPFTVSYTVAASQ